MYTEGQVHEKVKVGGTRVHVHRKVRHEGTCSQNQSPRQVLQAYLDHVDAG